MRSSGKTSLGLLIAVALGSGIACFGVAWLLTDIFSHKQDAKAKFVRVVEIDDTTTDPAIWGKNWPDQYDDYLKTADMTKTAFGGSERVERKPTEDDPREFVSKTKLEDIPQLKRMWAGYAFAKDFREERGHAYMLLDQVHTGRQKVGQPGTCINCHASTYVKMKELGNGDLTAGFEKINQMTYKEAHSHLPHPVACIDCHNPKTMALRVSRPAFMEGIAAVKAKAGIPDYKVNTMATHQEMRTYVCAQCHVEYYFKGKTKRLTFPWTKGLTVDDALAYYDERGFKDWTHAETGAPMLKAQHPEFETWSQSIHARSGVSCADCHMPYKRVGAKKISDHHVRSPLLNVNNSCGTCHKQSDKELVARVESIQRRHRKLVDTALDALVDLIDDIKAAKEAGATDEQLHDAQQWQRKASFFVDYVEAENSGGFHAPQESARILGDSINFSRKGQVALHKALLKKQPEAKKPTDE